MVANLDNLSAASAFDNAQRRPVMRQLAFPTPAEEAAFKAKEADSQRRQEAARRAARVIALSTQLGTRYSPERVKLDNYVVYDPRQKGVVAAVRAISVTIRDFVKQGRNLALFGTVGTGKDHLLAHLLYCAAREGLFCRYANGRTLFSQFRGTKGEHASGTENDLIEQFVTPDVVAISDPRPSTGQNTDYQLDVLYRVLDARYRAMRTTWVTANIDSTAAAGQSLSEPVWDRLQDGAEVLFCDWPSYRERQRQLQAKKPG
jgi:DNA replication protein DnaC